MFWELFGALGLLLLLFAFYLVSSGRYSHHHIAYNLLNFVGSLILGLYAYHIRSIIFIVLEFIWTMVALYFIVQNKK